MRLQTIRRRSGFTLLEVLLASALALVLMAALYVALDIQLRLASSGRDLIEQATLERAVTQRFESDLVMVLGPVAPAVSSTTTTTTTDSTGATTTTDSSDAITDATSTTDTIPFQAGVVGDTTTLTIFVSRTVKTNLLQQNSDNPPIVADIRRITYWLLADRGLARQEISYVTSEQVANISDPVIEQDKSEADYVIADEVTDLLFEYWDGSAWQESWDGTTLGADGKTPQGPPAAIRVHFWVNVPGKDPKEIRHTIAIRSAAGPATSDADLTTTNQ
ncbi:prepilin-type N-terminal cleavage/methylation domain-containing protein [Zavarzinella formosa]|uniref:prepilin-type N-terminal cleavage/methylation domain-containing protein n=1 Tax=Zavarzinella formosa TaxID=360055 RepID=UPI0002F22B24|nr:prepilin-type N-terminal cleavage/methylation domain-containing protein [Zavarzinella formosa]